MKKRITFTLEQELIDRLKKVSKETMIPQARLIEKSLNHMLNQYEKEQS